MNRDPNLNPDLNNEIIFEELIDEEWVLVEDDDILSPISPAIQDHLAPTNDSETWDFPGLTEWLDFFNS